MQKTTGPFDILLLIDIVEKTLKNRKMAKLYFFWDCDEVLVETVNAFRKFVNDEFNVLLPRDLHDFERIENQLEVERSTVTHWWSVFNTSNYLTKKGFGPHGELLNLILDLHHKGYESHIVTSKPEDECRNSTEKWRNKYFGKSIKTIQFCNSYSKNKNLIIRKKSLAISELITKEDFFIFAEDTHTHAIDVARAFPDNSLVYLLEKTWNRNQDLPKLKNLARVKDECKMVFKIRDFLGRSQFV
jgi:hypothetical protein